MNEILWRKFRGMVAVCLLGPAVLAAEESKTYTADEVSSLLERLEQAESKIGNFEEELGQLRSSQIQLLDTEEKLFDMVSFSSDSEIIKNSSYDEFLKKSEERWEAQKETNAELKKAIKASAQSGTSGSTLKVSGRIHFDHWGFPGDSPGVNVFETDDPNESPNDRIGFRRLRFGVKGDIKDNMVYKIEMEFAGGEETEFRDAYLGFKDLPFLQKVLIGNQKRPYGLDHLNSSRYNVFLERPFVIEAINQDARRLGIQSWGHSDDLAYNWRFGVFNMRLIQDEGNYISDHYQSEIAGRFAHTYWWDECTDGRGYAHFAIAGTAAHPDGSSLDDEFGDAVEDQFRTRPEARSASRWIDTGKIAGADWYQVIAAESVINVGPTQLVGEYQHMFLQRDGDDTDLEFGGGYAYISYFLTGEHIPWDRKTGTLGRVKPFENFFMVDRCNGCTGGGWGAWQVALRYSYADFTDQDIFGGVGESLTFGLNWHWNPNARMQFNYIHGEISDRNEVVGLTTYTSGDYDIVGTRFMVDF